MTKQSDTLNREKEQSREDQSDRREDALNALSLLREIGEKLPAVDAAAVVRESRDLAGQVS